MIVENKDLITFFMLVTNRDCIIADYAIKSYQKILNSKIDSRFKKFRLFVYLNCLSEDNIDYYYKRWKKYSYVTLFDNLNKIKAMTTKPYPGQPIISPEGIPRKTDDYAESYDELWTTELHKFKTAYIATVDADFEILNTDFYVDLMQKLDTNLNIIAASSDYSQTSPNPVYDTYSNRKIILYERNHTWFCIYRKEAFELTKTSHYYFEKINQYKDEIIAYDSASYFQYSLREKGYNFINSSIDYCGSFVHYGSASKNKTLNKLNINFYRKAYIFTNKGLINKKNNLTIKIINKLTRTLSKIAFGSYLKKMSEERSTYIYDEKPI